MIEQKITRERLTNYDPTDVELLQMFVLKAGGSFPFAITTFQEGLRAASEKFPPLGIFVDPKGINYLSKRFDTAFYNAHLALLNNEAWGIPMSDTSARKAIEARMGMVLTSGGVKCLEEAAAAANRVWSERES